MMALAFTKTRKQPEYILNGPADPGGRSILYLCNLEILGNGQVSEYPPPLWNQSDPGPADRFGRLALDKATRDGDFATPRLHQARHRVHAGGLSRSIATEQSQYAALRDRKRDVLKDVAVSVVAVYAL